MPCGCCCSQQVKHASLVVVVLHAPVLGGGVVLESVSLSGGGGVDVSGGTGSSSPVSVSSESVELLPLFVLPFGLPRRSGGSPSTDGVLQPVVAITNDRSTVGKSRKRGRIGRGDGARPPLRAVSARSAPADGRGLGCKLHGSRARSGTRGNRPPSAIHARLDLPALLRGSCDAEMTRISDPGGCSLHEGNRLSICRHVGVLSSSARSSPKKASRCGNTAVQRWHPSCCADRTCDERSWPPSA